MAATSCPSRLPSSRPCHPPLWPSLAPCGWSCGSPRVRCPRDPAFSSARAWDSQPEAHAPSARRRDFRLLLRGEGLPPGAAAPGARPRGGPAPAEDGPRPGPGAAPLLGHPRRQPLPAAAVAPPVRRVRGGGCWLPRPPRTPPGSPATSPGPSSLPRAPPGLPQPPPASPGPPSLPRAPPGLPQPPQGPPRLPKPPQGPPRLPRRLPASVGGRLAFSPPRCPFEGDSYRTRLVALDRAELPFPAHYQRFTVATFAFLDSGSSRALRGPVRTPCPVLGPLCPVPCALFWAPCAPVPCACSPCCCHHIPRRPASWGGRRFPDGSLHQVSWGPQCWSRGSRGGR